MHWTHPAALDKMLEDIRSNELKVTVEKKFNDYLSCEIKFNSDRTKAWIGQPHMIKKIDATFGEEVKSLQKYRTPGTPGLSMMKSITEEELLPPEMHSRMRTGVGMLLYLTKHSRPDISNAVRELTKVMDKPNRSHYKEMTRVIKHVLDTRFKGLKIAPLLVELVWTLVVFSDSDWATDKNDRKSVSGYMIFLNGVLICWRSKGQSTVSLSSSEAEWYACSEAVKEIPFIVQILQFLGITVEVPIKVKVDNIGAIHMSSNTATSSRTRHVDTRTFFVKDFQNEGVIKVEFVRSEDNVSDIATKNVTGELHDKHLDTYTADKDYLDKE